jgi:LPXTG-motif cell wall-anchored protein
VTVAETAQPAGLADTGATDTLGFVGGGLLLAGITVALYAARLKRTYGRLWVKR